MVDVPPRYARRADANILGGHFGDDQLECPLLHQAQMLLLPCSLPQINLMRSSATWGALTFSRRNLDADEAP